MGTGFVRSKKLSQPVRGAAMGLLLAVALPAFAQETGTVACVGTLLARDDQIKTYDTKQVIDVLANDTRPPGVAVYVRVNSTTCPGTAATDFDSVVFTPGQPLTANCEIEYLIWHDRGDASNGTVFVKADEPPAEIFSDGFESGNLSAWSAVE